MAAIATTTINPAAASDKEYKLVLTSEAGVSHFFLWPLVRDYIKDYPQAQVVILSSDEDGALHDFEEVDLALVCGNERFDAGEQLRFLFPEIVRPVCSALYLEKNGPFPNAAKLNGANLLHLHRKHWHSRAISWQPLDWEGWFASLHKGTCCKTIFPIFSPTPTRHLFRLLLTVKVSP